MNKQERLFINYIDEVYAAQHFTCEHLAANIDARTYTQIIEITVNFPQKDLLLLQHIECYKQLWQELKQEYKSVNDLYYIEYCKNGNPHIHGYIQIDFDINTMFHDEHIARMIWLSIMKRLPKNIYKINNKKYIYNDYIRMAKSPAVCLNLKNTLSNSWLDYIRKNAQN